MCGLCGDYDGNPHNDFTKADGTLVGNVNDFGNSWQTEKDEDDSWVYTHSSFCCNLRIYWFPWNLLEIQACDKLYMTRLMNGLWICTFLFHIVILGRKMKNTKIYYISNVGNVWIFILLLLKKYYYYLSCGCTVGHFERKNIIKNNFEKTNIKNYWLCTKCPITAVRIEAQIEILIHVFNYLPTNCLNSSYHSS